MKSHYVKQAYFHPEKKEDSPLTACRTSVCTAGSCMMPAVCIFHIEEEEEEQHFKGQKQSVIWGVKLLSAGVHV